MSPDKAEHQRFMRKVEGSKQRLAMQKYNRSEKRKLAVKRYIEAHKAELLAAEAARKAPGTKHYAQKMKQREDFRNLASNARQRWSAAEAAKLIELRATQMTNGDIALVLGRSIQSVEHKIRKLVKADVDLAFLLRGVCQ
jgi:CHAT domain-containing protein